MALLSEIDWFEWRGIKSTTYGVTVLNQPMPVKAAERVQTVTVPGRAGILTLLEGSNIYEDISLSATCVMDKDPSELINDSGIASASGRPRISVVTEWLSGADKVTFANRKEGYYKARIVNQIPFDKVLVNHPHLIFQVQFRCEPFLYLHSGDVPIIATSSPFNMKNEGNLPSRPLLEITAISGSDTSGSIVVGPYMTVIEFGAIPVFYHRPNLSAIGPGSGGYTQMTRWYGEPTLTPITSIKLDCDAKVAYSGELTSQQPPTPRSMRVTGDWLQFPSPGSFQLLFTQPKISQIKITPRWRALY